MSIYVRRPGNEWLKQFEKYLLGLIKLNKYSEKSVCSIAFINEGIKPETTSKYIRYLTEYGMIEEKDDGILNILIDIKDLETKNIIKDDKMKPYKEAKNKLEKGEMMEININENEKYIIYVKDCIIRKELPVDLGTWRYQNEQNLNIIEQEGSGKDTLPIKVNSKKKGKVNEDTG